jgi:hypothetical protein
MRRYLAATLIGAGAAVPGEEILSAYPLAHRVEQRTGGKRFDRLEDVMSQDEMRAIFDDYQKTAGYQVQQVSRPQG